MSDPKPHDKTKISSNASRHKYAREKGFNVTQISEQARAAALVNRPYQPPLPSSLLSSFFLSSVAVVAGGGASGRPFSILASILGRSSGSGFRSRAWAHWNLASSVRPTRQ